jgi:hypothetical protein
MLRVKRDRPRDILHLVANAVNALDEDFLFHLVKLAYRE